MKNVTQAFLLSLCLLLVLASAAINVEAQRSMQVTGKKATASGKGRNQSTAATGDKLKKKASPSRAAAIPANSVQVRIRYRKEYGYASNSSPFGRKGPYSCDIFTVYATRLNGKEPIGSAAIGYALMKMEGGYYVCESLIQNLPLNETIAVMTSIDLEQQSNAWMGGSQSQPPPGQERAILNGTSNVTLTSSNPRASVDFEMVYRPKKEPK